MGGKGLKMDIGEKVKVSSLSLHQSLDSSYDDIFKIHGRSVNPATMEVTLKMIRKVDWNM